MPPMSNGAAHAPDPYAIGVQSIGGPKVLEAALDGRPEVVRMLVRRIGGQSRHASEREAELVSEMEALRWELQKAGARIEGLETECARLRDQIEDKAEGRRLKLRILVTVADYWSMTVDDLCGPGRVSDMADARRCAAVLLKRMGCSHRVIANAMGRSDHTTATHYLHSVERPDVAARCLPAIRACAKVLGMEE